MLPRPINPKVNWPYASPAMKKTSKPAAWMKGRQRRKELSIYLRMLWEEPVNMVSQSSEVDVIGHRLVHDGAKFREAVRVTVDIEPATERCVHFAPLHNPSKLTGIRVARQLFGENKPQFAIFDTAFHRTLSGAAASYVASRVWIDQGIRHTVSMAQASATQAGVRRNRSGGSTPAAIGNLGSRSKKPIPKEGSLSCGS